MPGVPEPPPAVALRRVDVRRGGRRVLRDVSVTIRAGTVTLVSGANGAGKTSLLRVLAGVAPGARRRAAPPSAFVPERVALTAALAPRAWLAGMDRVRGARRPWADIAARWDLDAAALDASASRLSKGGLQRLILAEALTAPVGLLVLDEPWAGLDAAARPRLGTLLRERADEGAAVVVTDHSGAGDATLTPDVRLLVADGRVAAGDHAAAPPAARVAIRARDPRTGAVADHSAPRGEHDSLIRALLDAGHSIEEVRRA